MGRHPDAHCRRLGELDAAGEPHKDNVLLSGLWSSSERNPEPVANPPLWHCGFGLCNIDLIQCLGFCALPVYEVSAQGTGHDVEVFVTCLGIQLAKEVATPRGYWE